MSVEVKTGQGDLPTAGSMVIAMHEVDFLAIAMALDRLTALARYAPEPMRSEAFALAERWNNAAKARMLMPAPGTH